MALSWLDVRGAIRHGIADGGACGRRPMGIVIGHRYGWMCNNEPPEEGESSE